LRTGLVFHIVDRPKPPGFDSGQTTPEDDLTYFVRGHHNAAEHTLRFALTQYNAEKNAIQLNPDFDRGLLKQWEKEVERAYREVVRTGALLPIEEQVVHERSL
jgi:hypothetical protein